MLDFRFICWIKLWFIAPLIAQVFRVFIGFKLRRRHLETIYRAKRYYNLTICSRSLENEHLWYICRATARVLHASNKKESFDGLKEKTPVANDNFMYDSRGTAFIYASDYRGNLRPNASFTFNCILFFLSIALILLFPISKRILYTCIYAFTCM